MVQPDTYKIIKNRAGTISNDRRSLLYATGGSVGRFESPAGPGQSSGGGPAGEAPGSSENTPFYSSKNRTKFTD